MTVLPLPTRYFRAVAVVLAPVPPCAVVTGDAQDTPRVPLVVIGEPVTLNSLGSVSATDVTVPPVPVGVAQLPFSQRNFVLPADAPGSGTAPRACDAPEPTKSLMPNDAPTWFFLAVASAQNGNLDEARRNVEEALRLQPDFVQAKELLAKLE